MQKTVKKMISAWGIAVTTHHQGISTDTRGIFVPTTSRSWQNMENIFTELGETPRGQYNYIGNLEPVVEKGDVLEVLGKRYLIRRAEVVCDRKGPLYRWCLCVERGGNDTWGDLTSQN